MALDLQDLKISSQKAQTRASTRHQKVRWSPASFHVRTRIDADLSRADHSSSWFLTRAPPVLWCHDVVTFHTRSNPFVQPTRFEPDRPDLNRLKLKKKREREREREKRKSFDQVDLWLWQKKSKFWKGACPTQFFAYIPILESVSSFKTWRLCKLSKFQKVDFCTNFDQ